MYQLNPQPPKYARGAWMVLLLGLFLLPISPVSAQNLLLSLSSDVPDPGVISTRKVDALTVSVRSGSTVSFAESSGRDYRLEASGGFYWTQVQELARDAEAVTLKPVLLDDGDVEVLVERRSKEADREQSYQSTVVATPGEWLQLIGPASLAKHAKPAVKTYGTQRAAGKSLYLMVTLQ